MHEIIDFPKIKSPFVRVMKDNISIVTDEIAEGFEWVFTTPGVKAIDKLHGTNLCCIFDSGTLIHIDNRKTRVVSSPVITTDWGFSKTRMIEGVITAIEKGWIEPNYSGRVYGELIGPKFNSNIHGVSKNYFVPFSYLKKSCYWRSYLYNTYPKTFESVSMWFKELPSLFAQRFGEYDSKAEGLVFYHPDGKRMAKLRRDMFDWYKEGK